MFRPRAEDQATRDLIRPGADNQATTSSLISYY